MNGTDAINRERLAHELARLTELAEPQDRSLLNNAAATIRSLPCDHPDKQITRHGPPVTTRAGKCDVCGRLVRQVTRWEDTP